MLKQALIWAAVVGVGLTSAALRAEDAAKLYTAKCQSCHGKDGKGNAAMTKALKVDMAALSMVDEATLAKTDDELVLLTLDGVGKMPKYRGKISDADVKALVVHLRALKDAGAAK